MCIRVRSTANEEDPEVRRNRVPAVATVLALLTGFAGGCTTSAGAVDTSDVVVGADLALSGADSPVGKAYERALRLAVDQLNAARAAGARKVRLDVRDNRSDKNTSLANVDALTSDAGVTALLVSPCDECLPGIAITVGQRRVPTVALSGASAVAAPLDQRRYMFKLGPNAADDAAALARDLAQSGVRSIGLATADDSYGTEGRTAMLSEAQKVGLTVGPVASLVPADTDLGPAVNALLAQKTDALVVWARPGPAQQLAIAARGKGYKGRLYFDAVAGGELFMPGQVGAALENTTMVFTQTFAIDDVVAATPAKAARKQWFRDYVARYGGYFGYASFAADALQVVVSGVGKAGGTDRDRVRDSIETTQMDGLTGPIRITPTNHSGLTPQALTMLVARSGRWRLVG
jgi:branched-chain amino acid transport system substrate-binding protein